MRAPVLWMPPAQNLEEALRAEPVERDSLAATLPLAGGSVSVLLEPARPLEPAARAILEFWETRPPETAVRTGLERHIEYDGYFHVQRLTDIGPLVALGDAAVVAYYRVVTDLERGTSLNPQELEVLDRTFLTVFSLLGLDTRLATGRIGVLSVTATPYEPVDALMRWRIGHHAFFIVIQALMVTHLHLSSALRQRDHEAAELALERSTRLWEGTAAAFRYAADFSPQAYEDIVRPSMSPPFLKDGFSGFFSSDHVGMIRILKGLRPALQQLPPALSAAHERYLRALDIAYEAHAHVCESFVGAGSSLRGGHIERADSGPSFIRHTLKHRTMAAAGHGSDELR